jgi:hypothetical protein
VQLQEIVMQFLSLGWAMGVALLGVGFSAQERVISPDLAQINDSKTWTVINAEANTSEEDGKRVVHLSPKGHGGPGSAIGMALVEGVEFGQGTIDIDLKGKGKSQASFVGVAFGAADEKTFEAVYFRPFNFMRPGKGFRAHAVQYVSWPAHTWEKLRKETPGVYESTIKPVPDPAGWFHARINVTRNKVSVFVNDAPEPCLVVDRLSDREGGRVGLWVDSRDGAFANLKIIPAN